MLNVYCFAENVPFLGDFVFNGSDIDYATLYVPESSIANYISANGWKEFGAIKAIDNTTIDSNKCATPTISYCEGKLKYGCATAGVNYSSSVRTDDFNSFDTEEVLLSACYEISVVASKKGLIDSDVATAKLYWLPSSGSLEGAGINNVSMRGIAIQSAGGFITISGLDNNETVSFYGIDGKALGTTTAINGTTSFAAQSGSIIVAKIGKENIKIAVK